MSPVDRVVRRTREWVLLVPLTPKHLRRTPQGRLQICLTKDSYFSHREMSRNSNQRFPTRAHFDNLIVADAVKQRLHRRLPEPPESPDLPSSVVG